jgi:glycosyltransferase involved in cell wall biosynthesis
MKKIAYLHNRNGRNGIASAARLNFEALKASDRVKLVTPGMEASCDAIVMHFGAINRLVQAQNRIPVQALGIPIIGYWVVESSLIAPEMVEFATGLAQVWTSSEASKSALILSGVKPEVRVIPHPISPIGTTRPSRDGQPFTVLTCGSSPIARKGYDLALKTFQTAFPIADYPDVKWVLKIRGVAEDKVTSLTTMIDSDPRITLLSEDVPDMGALYDAADVYLQCHKAGAFELHCAEAAIYGLPVLTTDVGGVIDYLPAASRITPSGTAPNEAWDRLNQIGEWAVPDTDAMAVALRNLYEDAAARATLATECKAQATSHCDPARIAELMVEAVESLPPKASVDPRLVKFHKIERLLSDVKLGHRAARPGVEIVGGGVISQAAIGVLSHRRSGTHHLGETIGRAWKKPWAKSHVFPGMRDRGLKWIYIARNPIDTLHSTYEWFKSTGGAGNTIISKEIDKCTFDQFLKGRGGKLLGYLAHKQGQRDNCCANRGMFFDPIQHWADHVREAISEGMVVITHEQLRRDPTAVGLVVANKIGTEPESPFSAITDGVGYRPKPRPTGYAMPAWSASALILLNDTLTDASHGDPLLGMMGFSDLNAWIASGIPATS